MQSYLFLTVEQKAGGDTALCYGGRGALVRVEGAVTRLVHVTNIWI
jgi:hypothetical protein